MRLYDDDDKAAWQAYVAHADDATLYHDVRWKAVVERSFGHRTYYLLALDDGGAICGLLPMVHLKSILFGNFLVSLPFYTYGGISARDSATRSALLATAVEIAGGVGASHIELRHRDAACERLPYRAEKVSMQLELPANPELLWGRLGAKLRSQIKRPEREGIEVRLGGKELLDGFYRVFSENMRDLGTPVYPRRFFEWVLDEFPDTTRLCTAYLKERPIASSLLVGFRGALEIPWASSLRAYNRLGANMLMYWTALRFACEHEYHMFDFGRSTVGEGTFRFKAQWGARPVPLYWHYWLREPGPLPQLNPRNPKYRLAIELWRRLPVAVTRAVGPLVVKNLP